MKAMFIKNKINFRVRYSKALVSDSKCSHVCTSSARVQRRRHGDDGAMPQGGCPCLCVTRPGSPCRHRSRCAGWPCWAGPFIRSKSSIFRPAPKQQPTAIRSVRCSICRPASLVPHTTHTPHSHSQNQQRKFRPSRASKRSRPRQHTRPRMRERIREREGVLKR